MKKCREEWADERTIQEGFLEELTLEPQKGEHMAQEGLPSQVLRDDLKPIYCCSVDFTRGIKAPVLVPGPTFFPRIEFPRALIRVTALILLFYAKRIRAP